LWGKLAGAIGNDIWNRPVAHGTCWYKGKNRCRDESVEDLLWGKLAGAIGNDIWNRPVAHGTCWYKGKNRCRDESVEDLLWGKLAGAIGNDIWNRPVAHGTCWYKGKNRCRDEESEEELWGKKSVNRKVPMTDCQMCKGCYKLQYYRRGEEMSAGCKLSCKKCYPNGIKMTEED